MIKSKIIIGRADYADFPLLDLSGIMVKTDTGAYTSSIDCNYTKEIEKDGIKILVCKFLGSWHEKHNGKEYFFKTYKRKKVKSSNGIIEDRFLIVTEIKIFNNTYPIELTLTKRTSMKNDVLLGRKFLKKRFLIDPSKTYLSYKNIITTV